MSQVSDEIKLNWCIKNENGEFWLSDFGWNGIRQRRTAGDGSLLVSTFTDNEKLSAILPNGGRFFQFGAKTWEERVSELEAEGLTRSDAQGAVDVEILEGWRPRDFQPWMLLPKITTAKDSKV